MRMEQVVDQNNSLVTYSRDGVYGLLHKWKVGNKWFYQPFFLSHCTDPEYLPMKLAANILYSRLVDSGKIDKTQTFKEFAR